MRFLCLYKPAKEEGAPPQPEEMAAMGKLIEEMTKAGVIRLNGGKFTVIDGPFTETKELVAGFALIQAKSKEEAVAWTKRFLEVAGDGESEIRQVYDMSDCIPAQPAV